MNQLEDEKAIIDMREVNQKEATLIKLRTKGHQHFLEEEKARGEMSQIVLLEDKALLEMREKNQMEEEKAILEMIVMNQKEVTLINLRTKGHQHFPEEENVLGEMSQIVLLKDTREELRIVSHLKVLEVKKPLPQIVQTNLIDDIPVKLVTSSHLHTPEVKKRLKTKWLVGNRMEGQMSREPERVLLQTRHLLFNDAVCVEVS